MSAPIRGDEWKRDTAAPAENPTRVQAQEALDRDYALGRVTREVWRREFDRLSEPTTECYARRRV